jgi:hypothetical protein
MNVEFRILNMSNGGCKLKIIISKTFKKKRLFHKMPAVIKNYNKIIDSVRMSILLIKIIRNSYSAFNLIIKIPLQKASPPFQRGEEKGDLKLSKKTFIPNMLNNYNYPITSNLVYGCKTFGIIIFPSGV